ncbi:MAG: hypothetical protein KC503_12580 [Myxococcales bacterium]|nr:hypothetical protein [Myxococcales bacterium]
MSATPRLTSWSHAEFNDKLEEGGAGKEYVTYLRCKSHEVHLYIKVSSSRSDKYSCEYHFPAAEYDPVYPQTFWLSNAGKDALDRFKTRHSYSCQRSMRYAEVNAARVHMHQVQSSMGAIARSVGGMMGRNLVNWVAD